MEALYKYHCEFPHLIPIMLTYTDTIHRLAIEARKRVLEGKFNILASFYRDIS